MHDEYQTKMNQIQTTMKFLRHIGLCAAGLLFTANLSAQDIQLGDFGNETSFTETSLINNSSFMQAPEPALGSTYRTAIGLRGGETSGLTIKQFVGGASAIEAILGFWHHGLHATVLWERYVNAFGAPGLNWYYGAGGHVALWTDNVYYGYGKRRLDRYDNGNVGLGVDGIIGLEYKIPSVPIALSIDLKPYVEVISNGSIWGSLDPGLGVKVAF